MQMQDPTGKHQHFLLRGLGGLPSCRLSPHHVIAAGDLVEQVQHQLRHARQRVGMVCQPDADPLFPCKLGQSPIATATLDHAPML